MDLIKIKLGELESFCNSSLFRQFPVKPISPLRVEAYLHNPRAQTEDVVLYMFVEKNELFAFRTILPDFIQFQNRTVRFGWCSGVWVNPKHRGQKLSLILLKNVLTDWNEKIMFTNYNKSSESINLMTHKFKILKERTGARFYLYPNLNEIYQNRKGYKWLRLILPFLSVGISAVSFFKLLIRKDSLIESSYTELPTFDQECKSFLKKYPDSFFNRKEQELEWIIQYPWITQSEYSDFIYPFSYANVSHTLKITKIIEKEIFVGFFVYTIINSKMKVLYYFIEEGKLRLLIDIVSRIARKNKIEYLTILESQIAGLLKKSNTFAFSKDFTSNIYSTLDVTSDCNQMIFDGDGDNCFT